MLSTAAPQPVRWGIASTGNIAHDFAKALARVEDAHLLAVGSRSQERAQAFADTYGAARAYGSLETLLADDDVDVIYVCSPHSEHRREALAAVAAGKDVLVEKPFGLSGREAQDVFVAAARQGVFVMEALWSRFLPAHVRLRELVADDVIAARAAEVAVVFVGTSAEYENEGHDRTSFALPGRQDELVRRVAAANPRTVVVVNAGTAVDLPWADDVSAVLQVWLGGQEVDGAVADVLTGRAERVAGYR